MALLHQANVVLDHAALYIAFIKNDKNAFEALLNQRANFTYQNQNGLTVIHQIMKTVFEKLECDWVFPGKLKNDFVNSILDAHVKFENFTNPCDSNGISHFHVACMSNHKKAVTLFIQNGVSIDHAVNNNSLILPGYTPLHFAIRYCCLEVVEILSMYGANTNLQDAKGMTPLQILIKQKIEIMIREERNLKFNEQNYLYEMILDLLIKSSITDNKLVIDNSGLSNFHIISTMFASPNYPYYKKLEKLLINRIDINHAVKISSPICPGFTALHFAAYCNLKTFKFLLRFSKIKREAKHINGMSLFDMKIDHYEYEDICDILDKSVQLWKFIILSDAETSLHYVILSLCNLKLRHQLTTKVDADIWIPLDSPLWPGSTLLHLAVILLGDETEHEKFCLNCLDQGADVTAIDAQGQTPIHLAFRKQKIKLVKLMMKYHHKVVNPVDEDGLSHLHIACTIDDKSLIVKLLSTRTNVNSVYDGNSFSLIYEKSTPLHIAVNNGNIGAVQLLLERGADPYAKDINNATPLNWALTIDASKTESICKILLSNLNYALHNNFETKNCLRVLHIACYANDVHTVVKLLDFKKCINEAYVYKQPIHTKNRSISQYDLQAQSIFSQYTNFTPLHFAATRNCKKVVDLLIRRDAILCIEETKYFKSIGLSRYVECLKEAMSTIEGNYFIFKHLKNFNLTPLHIACFNLNVDKVKYLLDRSVDVNAQIGLDSPLWPKLTPLHLLMTRNFSQKTLTRPDIDYKIEDVFQLLLSERANVTLVNAEQNSPLHLAYKQFCQDNVDSRLVSLLLNCHSDFSINPVNNEGISHFYIACALSDVDMVKKFLENGVDVNELMADTFVNMYPTPLLIAVKSWPKVHDGTLLKTLETVSLLLDSNANRYVRTYQGNTVLHVAAETKSSFCRQILFERLINGGCDVNALNIYGATAFEVMLREDVSDREFELFLREIEYINVFNPISEAGLVAMIFSNGTCSMIMLLDVIRSNPHFAKTDDMGRTIIHNIASMSKTYEMDDDEFLEFIEDITKIVGCDIDYQDKSGRVAVHYAAKFNNTQALCALSAAEADIDIIDKNGKTALHVAAEFGNQKAVQELIKLGADISVLDSKRKSAFDYSLIETDISPITRILFIEIEKLKLSRFIDEKSKLISKVCHISQSDYNKVLFKHQLEKTKSIKIGPFSLSLYNYFSKINIMVDPYKSQIECRIINEFFNSKLNEHFHTDFSEVMSIIKLLQRKVLKILKSIDQTRDSLNIITGFELPELCFQAIFKYLDKTSIKRLIASTEETK